MSVHDPEGVEAIPITKRGGENGRGFHNYGEPFRCTYGTEIEVYESSRGDGPHVWLNLRTDPGRLTRQDYGEGTAHLNEEQARALVARLQAWLDEITSRWGRELDAPHAGSNGGKNTAKEIR